MEKGASCLKKAGDMVEFVTLFDPTRSDDDAPTASLKRIKGVLDYSKKFTDKIHALGHLIYDFLGLGEKRLDTSMQEVEEPIDWSLDEFEVPQQYDEFINDLNANGVTVNYLLHFWDKAGHANGEVLATPRFQTEDQVLDFLGFLKNLFDWCRDSSGWKRRHGKIVS